jgi:hypothetical protein
LTRISASEYHLAPLAHVQNILPAIQQDFKLASFTFTEDDVVMQMQEVALKGTSIQRTALAKHLILEACLAGEELSAIVRGPDARKRYAIFVASGNPSAPGFIANYVAELAAFYGTEPKGNLFDLADHLFENFGGFTILEWVKFFENCKRGLYKTEYQHIASRGINADFLHDWAVAFQTEGQSAVDNLRRQSAEHAEQSGIGQLDSGLPGQTIAERMAELEEERTRLNILESKAQKIRDQFEQDMTEVVPYTYWEKKEGIEWVMCEAADPDRQRSYTHPVRVDRQIAHYTRFVRFLEWFVTFDSSEADALAKRWVERWKADVLESGSGIAWEDYARIQSKKLRLLAYKLSPRVVLQNCTAQMPDMANKHPKEVADRIDSTLFAWSKAWPDVLENLLKRELMPPTKDEWLLHQAFLFADRMDLNFVTKEIRNP